VLSTDIDFFFFAYCQELYYSNFSPLVATFTDFVYFADLQLPSTSKSQRL